MAEPKDGASLTEKQVELLDELQKKMEAGKITDKQMATLGELHIRRLKPPELSATCKSELISTYLFMKFNRRAVSRRQMVVRYMEKGKSVEQDSIDMLSMVDNKIYSKNGERISNDYISGEVDIFEGPEIRKATKVIDIKSAWDSETFMLNMIGDLNQAYWWQMQGYLALTGAPVGEIVYCLVSTPETLINDEKRRLFYAMGVVTDEDPEYRVNADLLEYDMQYDDIDPRLRVIRFPVEKDDSAMLKVYARVEKCREWLSEVDKTHNKLLHLH